MCINLQLTHGRVDDAYEGGEGGGHRGEGGCGKRESTAKR